MTARVAVLVSGGGTNLQALLDAAARGQLPHGEISLVVSDRPDAYALRRAQAAGVETAVVTKPHLADQLHRLLTGRVDVIVLAGFLSILPAEFTDRWENRILNIHPSLIPSFCGEGMYGLRVHEQALRRGVKVTGATVHFVNGVCDGGPIVAQKAVPVLPGDTPETLQRRVMEQAEWVLLPQATEQVCAMVCAAGETETRNIREGGNYGV